MVDSEGIGLMIAVLISSRIRVVERWFRGRSRARDEASRAAQLEKELRVAEEDAGTCRGGRGGSLLV